MTRQLAAYTFNENRGILIIGVFWIASAPARRARIVLSRWQDCAQAVDQRSF